MLTWPEAIFYSVCILVGVPALGTALFVMIMIMSEDNKSIAGMLLVGIVGIFIGLFIGALWL